MAKHLHKLSAVAVGNFKKKGWYSDGGGLYLQVKESGHKSWLFRFMLHGDARGMGLGPVHTITLSEARAKAADCRKLLLAGIDPLDAKKDEKKAARLAAAKGTTS